MNPDCRDGKHASCSGDGWDVEADEPCPCPCICHARGEQVISFVQEVLHIELTPWQKQILAVLHDPAARCEVTRSCIKANKHKSKCAVLG